MRQGKHEARAGREVYCTHATGVNIERDLLEDICLYRRIILKLMLKKKGVKACNKIIWLRVWTVVGTTEHGSDTSDSIKYGDLLV
jgi:hypothetical protein